MWPLVPIFHSGTSNAGLAAVHGELSSPAFADGTTVHSVAVSLLSNSLALALLSLSSGEVQPARLAAAFVLSLLAYALTWLLTGHVPMGWVPGSKPVLPFRPALHSVA
eukprot:scaffold234290_cov33-Tisochrysis_lutea.AAC.1